MVKYGDLPAMIALGSPNPVWLAGEGETPPETITAAYRAVGGSDQIVTWSDNDEKTDTAAVAWLRQPR